jgi:hypothetical protein
MEEGCTCIAVIEREEAERTGYLKLYEFPEGEDVNGDPCPLHAPEKETIMTEEQKPFIDDNRAERGAQLRALVVSWDEGQTFLEALQEQQAAIDAGKFTPSDGWSVMGDELLGQYMSVRAQKVAELEAEKEAGPKLILPS